MRQIREHWRQYYLNHEVIGCWPYYYTYDHEGD